MLLKCGQELEIPFSSHKTVAFKIYIILYLLIISLYDKKIINMHGSLWNICFGYMIKL